MSSNSLQIFGIPVNSIFQKMIFGFIIGLIVISALVFSVNDPDPAWGDYWRVRPLIVTPIITAFGMCSFFLKDLLCPKETALKITVFILSVLGFIFSLWIGTILGLDGTLWN
ncbi:MAG: hypothetical protein KDC49_21270 [Saprospiraceae bacterium]|nr:hypothetical protein [Saprospiraceae bacterium]